MLSKDSIESPARSAIRQDDNAGNLEQEPNCALSQGTCREEMQHARSIPTKWNRAREATPHSRKGIEPNRIGIG